MKKLFIALLLVPLLKAQEVFLECTNPVFSKSWAGVKTDTHRLHIMLDKQLVKLNDKALITLDDEYKQYTQWTDGRFFWEETKTWNSNDKTTYTTTYTVSRSDLIFKISNKYNYPLKKQLDLAIYNCTKVDMEF